MSEGRDPEKFLKRFKNQHLKLVHFFPESENNPNTYLRCRIKKNYTQKQTKQDWQSLILFITSRILIENPP